MYFGLVNMRWLYSYREAVLLILSVHCHCGMRDHVAPVGVASPMRKRMVVSKSVTSSRRGLLQCAPAESSSLGIEPSVKTLLRPEDPGAGDISLLARRPDS